MGNNRETAAGDEAALAKEARRRRDRNRRRAHRRRLASRPPGGDGRARSLSPRAARLIRQAAAHTPTGPLPVPQQASFRAQVREAFVERWREAATARDRAALRRELQRAAARGRR